MEKEKWIEETLSALDGATRAEGPANLFERAWQRSQKRTAKVIPLRSTQFWAAAAGLALLIFANVFACLDFSKRQAAQNSANFAQEFFMSAPSTLEF